MAIRSPNSMKIFVTSAGVHVHPVVLDRSFAGDSSVFWVVVFGAVVCVFFKALGVLTIGIWARHLWKPRARSVRAILRSRMRPQRCKICVRACSWRRCNAQYDNQMENADVWRLRAHNATRLPRAWRLRRSSRLSSEVGLAWEQINQF